MFLVGIESVALYEMFITNDPFVCKLQALFEGICSWTKAGQGLHFLSCYKHQHKLFKIKYPPLEKGHQSEGNLGFNLFSYFFSWFCINSINTVFMENNSIL